MAATTNYTSLVANLIDVPNRAGDDDYANQTGLFIANAEAEFGRQILSRRAEMTTTLSTDADGFVTLPSDFIALRNSNIANGTLRTSLGSIPSGAVAQVFPITAGGDPYYIIVRGTQLAVNPPAARDVTFDYYARFVALTASNQTNWIVTNHPDLYLYGALKHAFIYLDDDRQIGKYAALADKAKQDIQDLYTIEFTMNAGMVLAGSTP